VALTQEVIDAAASLMSALEDDNRWLLDVVYLKLQSSGIAPPATTSHSSSSHLLHGCPVSDFLQTGFAFGMEHRNKSGADNGGSCWCTAITPLSLSLPALFRCSILAAKALFPA
jgi:hypothetical protein